MGSLLIESIRAVDFAKTHNWEIDFLKLPSGLAKPLFPGGFLPLTGCSFKMADASIYEVKGSVADFSVPLRQGARSISIKFLDDEQLQMEVLFEKWVNEVMFGNGEYVAMLDDAVGEFRIMRMDGRHNQTHRATLTVFPAGPLVFEGTNEVGLKEMSIELSIVKVQPA